MLVVFPSFPIEILHLITLQEEPEGVFGGDRQDPTEATHRFRDDTQLS